MKEQERQALRPSVGGMLVADLADEVAKLKARPEWATQNRLAVSLVKDEALNVLLMVLKSGARLSEHHTKGPIALQVLWGAVRLSAGGCEVTLQKGNLVALDRNVVHGLEALEESALLLTTAIV